MMLLALALILSSVQFRMWKKGDPEPEEFGSFNHVRWSGDQVSRLSISLMRLAIGAGVFFRGLRIRRLEPGSARRARRWMAVLAVLYAFGVFVALAGPFGGGNGAQGEGGYRYHWQIGDRIDDGDLAFVVSTRTIFALWSAANFMLLSIWLRDQPGSITNSSQ